MKRKLIYGAFMLVLLASCSKEEIVATSQNLANKKPLGVSVGIVQGVTNTKAIVADASFLPGAQVGVYISGTGYTDPTASSSCTYSTLNSAWTISPSLYLSSSDANVYGFYPYSSTASDVSYSGKTLKVIIPTTAKFDGSDVKDYMYATALGTGTAPNYSYPIATASNATGKDKVDLYFHHAMAKLTFKISKDASYPSASAAKLTNITLTNVTAAPFKTAPVGTTPDATMSLVNGTFAGLVTTGTTISLSAPNGEVLQTPTTGLLHPSTGSDYLAQTLVAPITLPTGAAADGTSIKLSLTVDGTVISTYLPNGLTAWAAGMNYTYTVTVKGRALEVNPTVTVVAFTDYTATTIPGVEVK